MILSAIVAVARNGIIGRNNELPWRLPADLARFKTLTLGHHLILGRRNFESIGRPLPGRTSLVLSRNSDLTIPGCTVVANLETAVSMATAAGDSEAFIIGGAEIYRLGLPHCQRLYWTRVLADVAGDVAFPDVDWSNWREESCEFRAADERNSYDMEFVTFERTRD